MTVLHNIPPVYNRESRILILGSFPSVKSREGEFFYHHPQNRFWQVLSAVLGCPAPGSIDEKKAMLTSHGIALWDVIASCEITGFQRQQHPAPPSPTTSAASRQKRTCGPFSATDRRLSACTGVSSRRLWIFPPPLCPPPAPPTPHGLLRG